MQKLSKFDYLLPKRVDVCMEMQILRTYVKNLSTYLQITSVIIIYVTQDSPGGTELKVA